jgi:hypothetical protein
MACIRILFDYYIYNNYKKKKILPKKNKWFFKNGTIVHANSIDEAEIKILNASLNTSNYYASEINMNFWEVQFNSDIFPDVYVHVKAPNGEIAANYAINLLIQDKESLEIVQDFESCLY